MNLKKLGYESNARLDNLLKIESEIKEVNHILSNEKDKNILEEKVLDILFRIEDEVSQIIWNKKERTALETEEVFNRYLNLNNIEINYENIDNVLDKLITVLYQEVKKRKIKLKHDLFENWKSYIRKGDSNDKLEFKTSDKIKLLQKVLYNMWYDTSKIQQYEEKINPERMRQIPYQIFHLTDENNKKTVLICNEIGQATFVYDWIISTSNFQDIQKWEEIDWIIPIKIIYNKNTFEKNLEIALNSKLEFNQKEEKIINENEEKADEIIKKATKEDIQELWQIWELKGEALSGRRWKNFANEWNEKNSKEKWFLLPTSIGWLIWKLWWDKYVSKSKDSIISLLEWKEFIK